MAHAPDTLASHAETSWRSAVRRGTAQDSVDGVVPGLVLTPESASMLSEMLAWATRDRLRVMPRGSGTKIQWGPRIHALDAVVSLAGLASPIEHGAADLVAVLPAGATLAVVNDTLAHEGQWLTLDPLSGGGATIGGLIATNDSGPRRVRYGAPRDLILGVDIVLADGTIAKSGGRVVKNVSGYDLARMLCGSFGTLGVITRATFKLAPRTAASCTATVAVERITDLGTLALALAGSALVPSAVDLVGPPWRLHVRIESTTAATRQTRAELLQFFHTHSVSADVVEGRDEDRLWEAAGDSLRRQTGALIKASVLPASLPAWLEACQQLTEKHRLAFTASGRATLGVCNVRLSSAGDDSDIDARLAQVIEALRMHAATTGGTVAVLEAPTAVKDRVPAWGDAGPAGRVIRAVKTSFDPHGTLNPERSFA